MLPLPRSSDALPARPFLASRSARRRTRFALAGLALASLATLPLDGRAQTVVQVRATATAGLTQMPVDAKRIDSPTGAALAESASNAAANDLGAGASATRASASLGLLTLRGDAADSAATNLDGNGFGAASTSALAGWSDRLTVSSPSHTGSGLLHAVVFLQPLGAAAAQAAAGSGSAQFDGGGSLVARGTGVFSASFGQRVGLAPSSYSLVNGSAAPGGIFGAWDVAIPFVFGQAFDFGASLTGLASSSAFAGGSSSAGVGLQLVWGGIQNATLPDPAQAAAASSWPTAGDLTITDFSVTGQSGTDWRLAAAVPEPATAALLPVGLLPVLGLARRRRGSTAR